MTSTVDDLQRFGFKLFFEPDPPLDVRAFIPIFHRWIQADALETLLIDVADYTHLSDGPCVLLAGHEGNYAIDRSEERIGLYHYRKQPQPGPLGDRLLGVARVLLQAGLRLEADQSLGVPCRFLGDEIQFVANDRLRAPAEPETIEAIRPLLMSFGDTLFGERFDRKVTESSQADRLRLTIRSTERAPLSDLHERISEVVQK